MSFMSDLTSNEARLINVLSRAFDLEYTELESSCMLEGPAYTWRGPLDVNALASATVVLATFLIRKVWQQMGDPPARVTVDRAHAALAFFTEGLARPIGWILPGSWDAIAGDYACSDGWIKLHTNYPHHRQAALQTLNLPVTATREQVTARIATETGQALEDRIVANHGVAGLQRTHGNWQALPQADALSQTPLINITSRSATGARRLNKSPSEQLPLQGVRVLDLTRVLAGPVASGLLAAWGADVLRIDPPGFEEVAGLVPITLAGKRSARLDLKSSEGMTTFKQLLADADILIHGYRDSAFSKLGLTQTVLLEVQPDLINVRLNAYGHTGPWRDRRGFDSIVQQSLGITDIGQQAFDADAPVPLACQALDYGTGWLMAACAAHGMLRLHLDKHVNTYALSLAQTGQMLIDLPERIDHLLPQPDSDLINRHSITTRTASGALQRISWPGRIGQTAPGMGFAPAIGSSVAEWKS